MTSVPVVGLIPGLGGTMLALVGAAVALAIVAGLLLVLRRSQSTDDTSLDASFNERPAADRNTAVPASRAPRTRSSRPGTESSGGPSPRVGAPSPREQPVNPGTTTSVANPSEPGPPVMTGPFANGGNGAIWASIHPEVKLLRLALWMERRDHRGEDAPPSLAHGKTFRTGMLGVYDGTGGSGAGLVTTDEGKTHTGAWLASRAVRSAAEDWFATELSQQRGIGTFSDNMRAALHQRLMGEMQQVTGSSRFAGTLQRDLPTTMATLAYRVNQDGSINTAAMWAGDSRVYLLTPDRGLQQITTDDNAAPDALSSLVDDPPMSNVIGANGEFVINLCLRPFATPAVLLCATDGCFGYVATPAHFEVLMLRSLAQAETPAAWMEELLTAIATTTNDDASLAAVAVGFEDFDDLKGAFTPRLADLERDHWEPFTAIDANDLNQLAGFRLQSWQQYRSTYEELMRSSGEPLGEQA